jgi:hypothetical protein
VAFEGIPRAGVRLLAERFDLPQPPELLPRGCVGRFADLCPLQDWVVALVDA